VNAADPDVTVELTRAFEELVDVIHEWRKLGRSTTTAGVKSQLLSRTPTFREDSLGFGTFREFAQAAQKAGYVQLRQQDNGHWLLMLPEEDSQALVKPRPSNQDHTNAVQLRPDLWTAFVDWSPIQRRLWDRQTARAYMFPVDDHGTPAWETQPDRFTEIHPASQNVQIEWMQSFAQRRPADERDILLRALAPEAPRGQFRRELSALGLQNAWRFELQQQVANFVAEWADANSVPQPLLSDKLDRSRSEARRPPAQKDGPQPGRRSLRSSGSSSPGSLSGTTEEKLRALLHTAIDKMPLSELASIPLRAEYFLTEE
jgi:hypothetical protein